MSPLLHIGRLLLPATLALSALTPGQSPAPSTTAPPGPKTAVDGHKNEAARFVESEPEIPTEWRRRLRRCSRRGQRRYCDGPRMVPVSRGAAAALAEELGLGEHRTASHILLARPEPTWVDAARTDGEPAEAETDSGALLWPVPKGRRGRGFGRVRRRALRHINHDGVDIPAPVGAPVVAAAGGLVAYADNGVRGYGNLVLIVHPDGSATVYAHLHAAYVFAGQHVQQGQRIGEVGNTGLSFAPHLHFEWHERGRARNPARLFLDAPEPRRRRRGG